MIVFHPIDVSGQPIASAIGRGIAKTTGVLTTDCGVPSMIPGFWVSSSFTHRLAAGDQTVA